MKLPYGFHEVVIDEYDPRVRYPRRRAKAWRDAMKPGKCRSLTKEEIKELYGAEFLAESTPKEG
jgi:hypothetical protein